MQSSTSTPPNGTRRSANDNTFDATGLVEQFKNDDLSKYFILIGSTNTIESVINAANNHGLLVMPRKWIVVINDPLANKKFWNRMTPIFSVTDIVIVKREPTIAYGLCNGLMEGCQLQLAFETLQQAIRKVIEFPQYDFNETNQIKAQTKNRIIAEMKVIKTITLQ